MKTCANCLEPYEPKYHCWEGKMVTSAKHCPDCIKNKSKIKWNKIKQDAEHLERERARKREYYHRVTKFKAY